MHSEPTEVLRAPEISSARAIGGLASAGEVSSPSLTHGLLSTMGIVQEAA